MPIAPPKQAEPGRPAEPCHKQDTGRPASLIVANGT